jgi:hypothetical protein
VAPPFGGCWQTRATPCRKLRNAPAERWRVHWAVPNQLSQGARLPHTTVLPVFLLMYEEPLHPDVTNSHSLALGTVLAVLPRLPSARGRHTRPSARGEPPPRSVRCSSLSRVSTHYCSADVGMGFLATQDEADVFFAHPAAFLARCAHNLSPLQISPVCSTECVAPARSTLQRLPRVLSGQARVRELD